MGVKDKAESVRNMFIFTFYTLTGSKVSEPPGTPISRFTFQVNAALHDPNHRTDSVRRLTFVSVSVSRWGLMMFLRCTGSGTGLQDSASPSAGFCKSLSHEEKQRQTGRLQGETQTSHLSVNSPTCEVHTKAKNSLTCYSFAAHPDPGSAGVSSLKGGSSSPLMLLKWDLSNL